MVNGGPYKLMPDQAFLQGHNHHLQLSLSGGCFLLHCKGSDVRRHNQFARCRLSSFGDKQNPGTWKKGKRKLVDADHGSGIPTSPTIMELGNKCSQSAASPASDMDMTEEDEAEIDVYDDDELRNCRGLVLDLAYRPINVINWKRSLCLDILEKAEILEYYDQVIYSPNRVFFIPAVLKVNTVIHSPRHKHMKITLNRKNIFMRDKYKCQYCSAEENLTIDHVYAASRGGGWTWENLVTACSTCNMKKASKTLEEAHMTLKKAPKEPKLLEDISLPPNYKTYRSMKIREGTPPEWLNYLPKALGVTLFQ